jgi:peptidoglycan/LPS O-acetylase OafA/YrhL
VFLAVKNGALTLADGFNSSTLFAFSPIPQAWTLGLELWFYLIAPFILRRPVKVLIAVFLASLAVRMALQFGFDLRGDPWSYRFFPSELAFFMLGALAGRVDRKTLVVLALAAAAAVFVSRTGGIGRMASLSFLVAATVAIPRLFAATKNIEADRILGELSYPIYLVHVLVGIFIVGPSALLITVIVAAGLYSFIDRPVDRWRQARVISHTPSAMLLNAINKVDA